jgi:hypothetical protein
VIRLEPLLLATEREDTARVACVHGSKYTRQHFELGRGLAGRKAPTGRQLGARASWMHSSSELDTGMAACIASTAVYCGLYAGCVGTWQDATLLRGVSQVRVGRTSALRWVGAWQDAMPLLRSTGVGCMQKPARRTPKGVLRDS